MKKIIGAVFIAGFVLISVDKKAFAAGVVINEFMPHPDNGGDWVELYNPTDAAIDISNWQIKDSASSAMKTLSGSIDAGGYLTIDVTNRLNNGGDSITLVDANGSTIDATSYTSDPGTNRTIGRSPNGSGGFTILTTSTQNGANSQSGQSVSSSGGSPSQAYPSTPPVGGQSTTTGISLSEYLPAPNSGEDEWVELYNSTDQEANVGGWKIDDIDGGSSPFTIPTEGNSAFIPPKSYKVYILPSGRFNNSGDSVRLLRPDGSIAEETSFTDAKNGVSFAKNSSGSWVQTQTPTPGSANSISTPPQRGGSATKTASPTPKSSTTNTASVLGTTTGNTEIGGSSSDNGGYSSGRNQSDTTDNQLPQLSQEATESSQAALKAFIKSSHKTSAVIDKRYIISGILVILLGGLFLGYRFWQYRKNKQLEIGPAP